MSIANLLVTNDYNLFANTMTLKEGNMSLIGATGLGGPTGSSGPQGLRGLSGATGMVGLQGFAGSTGLSGPSGALGLTGATGMGLGVTGLISVGDIPIFYSTNGTLQDLGLASNDVALLSSSNSFTGSNNTFNTITPSIINGTAINCTTFSGNGGAPTILPYQIYLGVGGTASLSGTSLCGLITLNQGSAPSFGPMAVITMPANFGTYAIFLSPADAGSASDFLSVYTTVDSGTQWTIHGFMSNTPDNFYYFLCSY